MNFILFAMINASALAAPLEFNGRCDVATPPVRISLTEDPRQNVTCEMREGKVLLHLERPPSLKIGSETYALKNEWHGYGDNCTEALKSFREFPEVHFLDEVSKVTLAVHADRDYSQISIAFGLRREACRGALIK